LARLRELVAAASFVHGKATAGPQARRVKNDEMPYAESPAASEARNLIINALQDLHQSDAHVGGDVTPVGRVLSQPI